MADFFPKVVATTHVEPSGWATPSIDGVPLGPNDAVLLAGQQDQARNGLFRVPAPDPSGPWARASNFDSPNEIDPGTSFYVCRGPWAGSIWLFVAEERPAEVDATPLRFEPYLRGSPTGGVPRLQRSQTIGVSPRFGWRAVPHENKVEVYEGSSLWLPVPGAVVEAPHRFRRRFAGLPPDTRYNVFAYEIGDGTLYDGTLDVELSASPAQLGPAEPGRRDDVYVKAGDPSRRLVGQALTDGGGELFKEGVPRPYLGPVLERA